MELVYEDMGLRELLRRSQTDVTPNPLEGLEFARAAYEKALRQDEQTADPTAAGEAAAKAALRAAQAHEPERDVFDWLNRSLENLSAGDAKTRRERVSACLLGGRAVSRLLLDGNKSVHPDSGYAFF